MKWKRKMRRKNLPKKYKCCGSEMLYKNRMANMCANNVGESGGQQNRKAVRNER